MKSIKHILLLAALLLGSLSVGASTITYEDWTSDNKGQSSSVSSKTYTFNVSAGSRLSFDWLVSSESNYDKLIVTLNGTEILNKSGEQSGTYEKAFTSSETYTLVVKYTKDHSVDNGSDYAQVSNVRLVSSVIASGICGTNLTWTLYANEALVIEGTGEMTDYFNSDVPWCNYRTSIRELIIKEGVTSIGYQAFYSCSSLASIIIPESVTRIGEKAFYETAWYYNQPDGVVYLDWWVLDYKGDMPSNTSLVINAGTKGLADCAFMDCYGLTSINIPEGVTSIGERAFSWCTSLTSITIPESVTLIEDQPFVECSSLEYVVINCPKVGDWFDDSSSIKEIVLGKSVTEIGEHAFSWCKSLTSVNIPENVTTIGNYAFYNCSSLTSITIPEGVTSIGSMAFYNCSSLTSISIPESVTEIGHEAFDGTPWYDNQPDGVIYAGKVLYKYKGTMPENTSIEVREGTVSISGHAFRECSGLTAIILPESVTSIGNAAFKDCNGLTSIDIPKNVTYLEGWTFSDCSSLASITIPDGVTTIGLSAFYNCSSLTSVVLPESVTSILWAAFAGCSSLASIIIPESVTLIGDQAFGDCSSLTSIIIPKSVTYIERSAFCGCISLTSMAVEKGNTVYDSRNNCNAIIETSSNTLIAGCVSTIIPEDVTSIGKWAFEGCSRLTSIIIPESVTSIGNSVFYGCSSLATIICNAVTPPTIGASNTFDGVDKSIPVYVPAESVEAYQSAAYWSEFSNIQAISSDVASGTCGDNLTWKLTEEYELIIEGTGDMYDYGYGDTPWSEYCEAIKTVIISEGVTSIGDYAFQGCSNFAFITIPESVTLIGDNAFSSCSSLTSIEIPNSVVEIGQAVFQYCNSLQSINIPKETQSIGRCISYGCSNLVSIVVEDGNTKYDSRENCNAIIEKASNSLIAGCQSTIIPQSVDHIAYAAFAGLTTLSSIIIPEGVTSLGEGAFYGCSGLTSVSIPSSLVTVEGRCFESCDGLAEVHINDLDSWCKVEFIRKLTAVNFSNPLAIAQKLYINNELVENVEIPSTITEIKEASFINCSSLISVTIPAGVKKIENQAFYGCTGLTSIISHAVTPPTIGSSDTFDEVDKSIPVYVPAGSVDAYKAAAYWSEFSNIQPIPSSDIASGTCGDNLTWRLTEEYELIIEGTGAMTDYTYYAVAPWHNYRTSIEKITIEEGVTSIGFKVFDGCINLTSVTIPEGVTSIAGSAFYNCSSLTSINIPEGVMSIGYEAFNGCGSLTAINIPESMTSIGGHPFKYCSSLTSIVVAEGNRIYDSRNGCNAIIESSSNTLIQGCSSTIIPEGVMSIGDCAFEGCSDLTSVNLPEGMRSIGGWAFKACNSLISVAIPEGVTSIRESAFEGCTNLAELNIPEGVTSIGGSAFEGCINLTQLNIPEGLTCINNYTFKGCSGLTEIRIPASVMTIEFEAFMNCANLATVTFAEESRLEGIAASAFCYCNSLTDIVIPMDVTSIGTWAFEGCTSLVSVTIHEKMKSIGAKAFRTCSSLQEFYCYAESVPETPEGNTFEETPIENVTLYVPTSSVDDYKATAPWSNFGNFVGNTNEMVTGITLNQTSKTLIVGNSLTLIATITPSYATNLSVTWTSSDEFIASVDDMGQVVAIAPGTVTITATAKDGSGVSASCEITVEQLYVDYVTITINQYGSGTYSSEYALDFSEVKVLKAYVATGYNHLTGEVTLLRVRTAEAGTGLLVKGIPGMSYKVPVLESTADHTLNMLVATLEKTKVNGHSDDGVYANYKYTVVKEQSPEPLFYQFADGASLSAGKAYLQIPVAWLPATGQKALRYRFDEGETTDIEDTTANGGQSTVIYDLMGRRVASPKKGEVYIINNKKVVY